MGHVSNKPDQQRHFMPLSMPVRNISKSDSILHGLEIDQSDFDNKLPSTKYKSAVGTHLDGNFHTINKKNTE